ncbi:DUF4178 domain-containing protein [Chryseobacterium populi]|uniref:DUF4178 domain-containing protein n=1 Tax=Chryseobacterium populi TaxID=1144316 RepID=J2KSW9_9FLAO|nr:DUF4178 domain-containing protein [Chryseobacterium populi]EJL76108.1 hypothetical protein PMI13_00078 [Chryseobacterium populi]
MDYVCPICKTENKHEINFPVGEYVCRSCSNLISTVKNSSQKVVRKPVENVVLNIGQKGVIDQAEYSVIGIIVRKYGSGTFWREYYLKDQKGNNAFLSESNGHWVFLLPMPIGKFRKKSSKQIILNDRTYRWYETTECHIDAAAGFFEDALNFNIATYKEYVNGTEMISQEQSGSSNEHFFGSHISKYTVKKAFEISDLPNYSGIGIVQPFYVNIKQTINILCIAALLICLLQLYVYTSRTNYSVFEQTVRFEDVKNKEMASKSFTLSGGSAPLKVNLHSAVDNSWANVQLSLVNENTNEAVYTSKDIEEYHGYEDGENWSEGSTTEEFNFCGVASGKYHFVISAEKQETIISTTSASNYYISPDGNITLSREPSGIVNVVNNNTRESVAFGDLETLKKDQSAMGSLVSKTFGKQNLDSLLNINTTLSEASQNTVIRDGSSVDIKATWLPVSFWNFGIILGLMLIFFIACYWGNRLFSISKWSESSNSPYTQS